jgi:hypothetical protein
MRQNSKWGFCTWIKNDGKWWKWCKKFYLGLPTWTMFTKAACAHFDKESHFLGQLTELKKTRFVTNFITSFDQLAIHIEVLLNDFYLECFINGLNDFIKAHVCMHDPVTWLNACQVSREVKNIL